MKKLIFILFLFILIPVVTKAQTPYYTESFETYDSLHLPLGWFKLNNLTTIVIDPLWNWTVRDSGVALPGITFSPGRGQRSYNGTKALGVTWYTAVDTGGVIQESNADAWLITKKFNNIPVDGFLSFYACGGSTSYGDSMEVLISTTDSTVASFTHHVETIYWPNPSPFGTFAPYLYDLSAYAHQNIRIAFRYVSANNGSNGFAVMLDYFQMLGTVGISQIGTNIPNKFALHQNYPNPFNPVTKIKFDVPKNTNVKIEVFNNLGQVIKVLQDGNVSAGYYETDFNATNLSSGMYYYRLTAGNFIETKKMVVVK